MCSSDLYTLISEPSDAAAIRASTASTPRGKGAAKTVKAPKVKAVKTAAPKSTKSVADIKAANLEKLKAVGANRAKAAKRVREFDDVTEQFGNSGEIGTSFNVDRDWDSIDGLDLQKLL